MAREHYYGRQCKQFVTETFEGSLPKFLAAFASEKRLTEKEIDALVYDEEDITLAEKIIKTFQEAV